jgi:DNA mismatch repair protein MutL
VKEEMAKIKCLAPHVADLIAAGEVVERPASVVKELVENAIDAGATSVTVEIKRGGMSYIRVTDNGCGIAPEEVETAFLRHATSKIRDQKDLAAIGTLGFRGEALAAISAVSKVELQTRTQERDMGCALLLDGGVKRTKEDMGCAQGTTIIIRDLFFNTPARLKFVKRDVTEGAAVFAAVQHIALSHPEISFRFLRDGRQDLMTPGDGDLQSAVYAVLGRDIALGFLPCKGGNDSIGVEGFLSRPACCRGTRSYQHFFVNGRYVKSKTMMAALEEGYKNTKMVGKFPACVLHITTSLDTVDVNVHPTKTEVKFVNDKLLFNAVYGAVRQTLEQEHGHPQVQMKEQKTTAVPKKDFFQTMTAEEYRSKGKETVLSLQDSAPSVWAQPPAAPPPPVHVVPKPFLSTRSGGTAAKAPAEEFKDIDLPIFTELPARNSLPQRREKPAVKEEKPAPIVGKEKKQADFPKENVTKVEKVETPAVPKPKPAPMPEPEPLVLPEEPLMPTEETPAWRLAGEVLDTYIIVEQGDTVFFIDKHAAHERMNFDRLKAQDYQPMRQLLLTPVIFTPSPEEGAALLAHLELLDQFGFEVEDFGGGKIIVRQTPDYLTAGETEATLTQLAERLMVTGTADPSAARDEVLHTMACKNAIKGGWKSGREELQVVAEAVMSGQVKYCPHGRPVAIEMTKKQLEKQFKRA